MNYYTSIILLAFISRWLQLAVCYDNDELQSLDDIIFSKDPKTEISPETTLSYLRRLLRYEYDGFVLGAKSEKIRRLENLISLASLNANQCNQQVLEQAEANYKPDAKNIKPNLDNYYKFYLDRKLQFCLKELQAQVGDYAAKLSQRKKDNYFILKNSLVLFNPDLDLSSIETLKYSRENLEKAMLYYLADLSPKMMQLARFERHFFYETWYKYSYPLCGKGDAQALFELGWLYDKFVSESRQAQLATSTDYFQIDWIASGRMCNVLRKEEISFNGHINDLLTLWRKTGSKKALMKSKNCSNDIGTSSSTSRMNDQCDNKSDPQHFCLRKLIGC